METSISGVITILNFLSSIQEFSYFKIKRASSVVLLRTFDIFTFFVVLMFGSTMIHKVLSIEPMAKTIDSLGQLQNMKNMKIYIVKNSFVDDVISDIESLKEMESLGYKLISLRLVWYFVTKIVLTYCKKKLKAENLQKFLDH